MTRQLRAAIMAAYVTFRTSRPGMALSVLQGKPVAYRLTINGTLTIDREQATIVGCRIGPPLRTDDPPAVNIQKWFRS